MATAHHEAPPTGWRLPDEGQRKDDPLLACLVMLTRLEERPMSAEALTAGLPLADNRLTPDLFVRAAARAGFAARIVKRPLARLSNLVLPAVLLLDDAQAALALSVDRENGTVTLMQPEAGGGERRVSLAELQGQYTGYAIFVRPEHRFDERAPEVLHTSDRNWFWGTLSRSWRIYRDVLVASFLINLFALASPLFIMNVYDRVVPNNAVETLWVLAAGVVIVFGFDLLLRGLRGYFVDVAGRKADVVLSSMIFEKVLGLRMEARPVSVGAFANNLGEFESIRNFITSATISTLVDLPFVALFLAVIAFLGGWLVLVPLLGMPVILIYGLLIQGPLRRAIENTFRASAQKNATLIESLVGAETVKALGAESPIQRKWEQAVGFIARWGVRSRLLSSSAVNVAIFVQQLATVGVVAFGVYLVGEGTLSLGGLIASVILTSRAMAPMAQVANLAAHYHQARAALKTLNRIMTLPSERPADKAFLHRPKLKGAIEFAKVNFSYPHQSGYALHGVSFNIAPGERVGIIGRTGSGKSTIERLILGLYTPTQGSVRIDGFDVQQLDPAEVRRNIGYVSQDVTLFYGTLRENILFGAPYADDELMLRAADIAGVSAFAGLHPRGFDMQLGERGEGLSGGQRQSVALARALLLDPPVVLLDEPSSSMDNSTEERLKQQLAAALENKTVLLVTHRASLLSLVDRLLVLDGGKLIADGPKELVLEALRAGKLRGQGATPATEDE
ncbi:MAG: type I secretion system permease/ATPase [Gammaproteobacteria bacterium]|nr:type I secretion system permease/ATPase [Gammaproteobacteria bacterium]